MKNFIFLIVGEGFNTPPFRAVKKVLNLETNTLPKQHTSSIRARLLIVVSINLMLAACDNGTIRAEYRPVLPELPEHWEEHLGKAHWRLEWLDRQGFWQEADILPGNEPPLLPLVHEWSNPVLAWPFWPSLNLLPAMMRPAGAIYPWDVSGGKITLSWKGGVEAIFWKELADSERTTAASQTRLPWYLDWPRFRTLLAEGNIPENVRQDLWLPDWKDIAQRTVQSGFDSRRIVSRPLSSIRIPALGGLWIGSSPFASPLYSDSENYMEISVGVITDTWISGEGILKASSSGWVFIPAIDYGN